MKAVTVAFCVVFVLGRCEAEGFFESLGSRIRDAVQPHVEDLRESVGDLQRELEESGGIDGLREDGRLAMEKFNEHGRRATDRAAGLFTRLLDTIESKIDDASGAVRSGLSTLVHSGRSLLRETRRPGTLTSGQEEEGQDEERTSIRVSRTRRSVVLAEQEGEVQRRANNNNNNNNNNNANNNNNVMKDLKPFLDGYNQHFREVISTLRDVRYELSSIKWSLEKQMNPRNIQKEQEAKEDLLSKETLGELEAILGGENSVPRSRKARSVGKEDIGRGSKVRRYHDSFKEQLFEMSKLLRSIRYDVSNIKAKLH